MYGGGLNEMPCFRTHIKLVHVDPQIETNSIRKRGFPIWECLPAHFRTVITKWKQWSPYGKHSHMVIFTSIPKWAWTLFGNGLVTERSPFGNGDPFLYGDPHIEMGIRSICFPIWKRGFTLSIWGCFYLRFHMAITIWKRGTVSFSSLYGNRDHHMEMGISKGCVNPRFHMAITICKQRDGANNGNAQRFESITITKENLGEDTLQCVTWRSPKICSPFPYGESPYGNGQRESNIPIWGVPVSE